MDARIQEKSHKGLKVVLTVCLPERKEAAGAFENYPRFIKGIDVDAKQGNL